MGFKSDGIRWTWNDKSTTPCSNWYTTTTNIDEPVINMKDTITDSELEETIKKLKDSKLTVEAVPPVIPPMQYGWVCPKCGRTNAPWVSQCSCNAMPWVKVNTSPAPAFTASPCQTCSNNPANGGSGNCNCTLGTCPVTC